MLSTLNKADEYPMIVNKEMRNGTHINLCRSTYLLAKKRQIRFATNA
jgi:hypothetical protein